MVKVIKSDGDYETALSEIERLLERNVSPGTPEGDLLEVLTLLIDDYESRRLEALVPSALDAIRFRVEQQNLSPRDLVPFIGSRSKVSEVLSGKRRLTLSMIRALHSGLGIPAKVLLEGRDISDLEEPALDWSRFPIREMIRRGWLKGAAGDVRELAEDVVRRFFAPLGPARAAVALYRQTKHVRSARDMDEYALTAWTARVMIRALENPPSAEYRAAVVNLQFMRDLGRLSVFEQGPTLAREYLAKHGVSLVVEPHLPRTYLDGAAIMTESSKPIVGLTLRYDRIDNFWFCLMHELGHLSLHLGEKPIQFYDDLDVGSRGDAREEQADQLAGQALIPEDAWRKSPASRLRSPEAVRQLADQLGIHPAIVAGRVRHHFKSYRVLNQLVGHAQVRRLFGEISKGW